jgi:hypothetical protein
VKSYYISSCCEYLLLKKVLDCCAAPGGKTTHLAALMQNKGIIVAIDRAQKRVEQLAKNCVKLGVWWMIFFLFLLLFVFSFLRRKIGTTCVSVSQADATKLVFQKNEETKTKKQTKRQRTEPNAVTDLCSPKEFLETKTPCLHPQFLPATFDKYDFYFLFNIVPLPKESLLTHHARELGFDQL